MKEDGQLLLATDHDDYFEWMLEHVHDHQSFELLTKTKERWLNKPDLWTTTRFQEKANSEGRISRFLRLKRK
jgi:tRNA G46 methylase TrmB